MKRIAIDTPGCAAETDQLVLPLVAADLLAEDRNDRAVIDVGIRDASRFEWRVSLPLPSQGELAYRIECRFELPWTGSRMSPWDQLQELTRLEGPSTITTSEDTTIDTVRQRVIALVAMLRRTREGFTRHCRALASGSPEAKHPHGGAHAFLTVWLDAALTALAEARASLRRDGQRDSPELARERALADELVSARLLDLLATAQSTIDTTIRAMPAPGEEVTAALALLDDRLTRALDREIVYRAARGFPAADPDSPEKLERYVERAGRLKKHFQEPLVLERDVRHVNERVQQWLTSVAALFAGALYVVMQLLIAHYPHSDAPSISTGIVILALLGGLAYSIRDRLKELGRVWLTGKAYRYHAQRSIRWRLPRRRRRAEDEVALAREWCNETVLRRPDPLNPESGTLLHVTLVEHIHQGRVLARSGLSTAGVRRLSHSFRYDLSPLLPTLQDVVKAVAVVDPETHRARFVDAPRRYQVPVEVVVVMAGRRDIVTATLVIDKQGIVRFDGRLDPAYPEAEGIPRLSDAALPAEV